MNGHKLQGLAQFSIYDMFLLLDTDAFYLFDYSKFVS